MESGERVMVLGAGGREHALAWKLAQSPRVERVFVIPGNAGMVSSACTSKPERKIVRVSISETDISGIIAAAKKENVRLIVPGPEAPIVFGIADAGRDAGIDVFGPSARVAMATEGSKCAAKEFMARHDIPTAPFRCFKPGERIQAREWIEYCDLPVVIKDDGLAGGKGVTIAKSMAEAMASARRLFDRGRSIVVERYLVGEELTFIYIVAGDQYLPLAPAQDRKIFKKKMTGGMAALSADGLISEALQRKIADRIVEPTLRGLIQEGLPYVGFLYFGLMIADGEPYLLEYNCRLGDPEAQVILMRMWNDLYLVIRAALGGELPAVNLVWDPGAAACVVMAAAGYPGETRKGDIVSGAAFAENHTGVKVFYAGVEEENGNLVTCGGRVLGVTALRPTSALAKRQVYRAVRRILWPGRQYLRVLDRAPISRPPR